MVVIVTVVVAAAPRVTVPFWTDFNPAACTVSWAKSPRKARAQRT